MRNGNVRRELKGLCEQPKSGNQSRLARERAAQRQQHSSTAHALFGSKVSGPRMATSGVAVVTCQAGNRPQIRSETVLASRNRAMREPRPKERALTQGLSRHLVDSDFRHVGFDVEIVRHLQPTGNSQPPTVNSQSRDTACRTQSGERRTVNRVNRANLTTPTPTTGSGPESEPAGRTDGVTKAGGGVTHHELVFRVLDVGRLDDHHALCGVRLNRAVQRPRVCRNTAGTQHSRAQKAQRTR